MSYGNPSRHLEECESTNDLASEWAQDPSDPAPDGALVTADTQTKGRGRRGRSWDSGAGDNVIMSLVLRDTNPSQTQWQIGFVCALAVTDALRSHGIEGQIKWPNDVLIDGRKVAGILVEVPVQSRDFGWIAIAGIGVNVNRAGFADAAQYPVPPTSIFLEAGVSISPRELADEIAHCIEVWEKERRLGNWTAILDEVRARLAVGVALTRGGSTGVLQDIGAEGQAIVQLNPGTFAEWRTVDYEAGLNSV